MRLQECYDTKNLCVSHLISGSYFLVVFIKKSQWLLHNDAPVTDARRKRYSVGKKPVTYQ